MADVLKGPVKTPVGDQGGLGGEAPHGIPPTKKVPDPLGLVKA